MPAPRDHVRVPGGSPARSAARFGAWWAAMFAVWVVLVDTIARDELVLGAAAATIAAATAFTVQRRGYIHFEPRAVWLREAPRLAWTVFTDCGLLGSALWRRVVRREDVEGVVISVPFDYGGDGGRDGARRALVNFSVSLTPNSFVIDIDPEAGSLLVHQLVPRPLDAVLEQQSSRAHARGIGAKT